MDIGSEARAPRAKDLAPYLPRLDDIDAREAELLYRLAAGAPSAMA